MSEIQEKQIFTNWTVIGFDALESYRNHPLIVCQCTCGILRSVRKEGLLYGSSKSCGCLQQIASSNLCKERCKDPNGLFRVNQHKYIKTRVGEKNLMFGRKGKNHPKWKDIKAPRPEQKRIRESDEYKEWRKMVFERDDYTCQKCHRKGIVLRCHHIVNFASDKSLRFDVNNGITLCYKHHCEFHKLYGFRNNNNMQLQEYLLT